MSGIAHHKSNIGRYYSDTYEEHEMIHAIFNEPRGTRG
jgi:hypothetical protein